MAFHCRAAAAARRGGHNRVVQGRTTVGAAKARWVALAAAVAVAGCATRSADVAPAPVDPATFGEWTCTRIHDETDLVQQRAADLAWTVDERAGQHFVALGVGLSVFWPALLAMRPDGADSQALAQLKGRFEALQVAAQQKGCPPRPASLPPDRAALMPVLPGERLVYEDRQGVRDPLGGRVLSIVALRRDEIEFVLDRDGRTGTWRQDLAGNVLQAPAGTVIWERLLKREMALGQVVAGDMRVVGEPFQRARVRGQVVAIGPQKIAGRRFDAVVVELFGDVTQGDSSTRLDGAIVVDQHSGVLLRLDLRSAQPPFQMQRRLVRVEAASP